MRHILAWGAWVIGVTMVLSLCTGCADIGRAGAKMHGLKVVTAADCRHAFHTTPCTTGEDKQ